MAEGKTIAKAYVQILPSTKGIAGNLESALGGEATSAGKSAGAKFGSAFGSVIGTTAKVGAAAIGAATAAVGGFATASVSAGQEFDSAMSQVAATMGFSTEELNRSGSAASETFSRLSSFAKEMGATTAFSATESAEALNYMALAGYDADTSIAMLPNVLSLAAAGGIDLANASDMVTDAQSALGLSIEETNVMVDQMAKASSKSNTSVAQLGDALLTVGATGRTASGGTAELATILGVLADNGIKGAEGGTHLRNILLAMNPTTDKAANAWEKLGVSGYDANGNLRPLEDTFNDLRVAMKDMSDQEKTSMLTAMFNKTDLASINALLGTEATRFTELSGAIRDSKDAASNMADVQLDNLAGDITLFQSALEGAKIAVSDGLTPTIREFVQMGTDSLSNLTTALNAGDLEGAFGAIGDFLGDLFNKISDMLPQLLDMGISLLQSFLNSIKENISSISESLGTIIQSMGEAMMQAWPEIIPILMELVGSIGSTLLEMLPQLIEVGMQVIMQLVTGITEALPTLIPTIVEVVLNIVDTLLDNVDLLIDGAIGLIVGLAEGLINALPILIERLPEIVIKIADALITNAPKLLEAGIQLTLQLGVGLLQALPDLLVAAAKLLLELFIKFMEFKEKMKEVGTNIVDGIKQGISNAWESFKSWIADMIGGVVDVVKGKLGIHSPSKVFANSVGKWIPAGIQVGIEDNLGVLDDAMQSVNDELTRDSVKLQTQVNGNMAYQTSTVNASSSATPNDIAAMLATYLPLIAQGGNVSISLEGDANGLFRMVQDKNKIYAKANGRSAFA